MTGLGQEEGCWVMWKLYVLPDHQGGGFGPAARTPSRDLGEELMWMSRAL